MPVQNIAAPAEGGALGQGFDPGAARLPPGDSFFVAEFFHCICLEKYE